MGQVDKMVQKSKSRQRVRGRIKHASLLLLGNQESYPDSDLSSQSQTSHQRDETFLDGETNSKRWGTLRGWERFRWVLIRMTNPTLYCLLSVSIKDWISKILNFNTVVYFWSDKPEFRVWRREDVSNRKQVVTVHYVLVRVQEVPIVVQ